MEDMQKDLTTLGSAVGKTLSSPYSMQDFEAGRTTPKGVSAETAVSGEEFEPVGSSIRQASQQEIIDGVANLEGIRGLYEPMEDNWKGNGSVTQEYFGQENLPLANRDKTIVRKDYQQRIKQLENPDNKGLRGGRYYMVPSLEGKGAKNKTGYDIGHGLLVKEEWLGKDKSKWPKVGGIPINVKDGLLPAQVDDLVDQHITGIENDLKGLVPRWDDMDPSLQTFFIDFAYNGGIGALKDSSPNTMKALESGEPLEAAIRTFNYWNITDGVTQQKEASRGLLNRRINEYNEMAKALGAPKVTSYSWGEGRAKVHFSNKLKAGSGEYFGRQDVMYKSSGIKGGRVDYKPTGGRF